VQEKEDNSQVDERSNERRSHIPKGKDSFVRGEAAKASFDTMSETSQVGEGDSSTYSGPTEVPAPSGFTWAKRRKEAAVQSTISDGSKSKISALDPSFAKTSYLTKKENDDLLSRVLNKHAMQKQQHQLERPDSFDASDIYHSHNISMTFSEKEETDSLRSKKVREQSQH
jgi:hypothetical protein